jgi:hypothetical protein
MACSVLTRFCFAVSPVVVLLGFGLSAGGEITPCSPTTLAALPEARQKDLLEMQKHVEAGPLFQSLLRWRMQGSGCAMKVDGDDVVFSYSFADHVTLESKSNPSIEYSEQTVHVRGMRADRAVALLKKSELDSMGSGGCGIDWDKPVNSSNAAGKERSYRGSSCNCQARLVYRGKLVVGLVLKSSC